MIPVKRWRVCAVVLITATGALVSSLSASAEPTAGETSAVDFAVGVSDSDDDTFAHPSWAGLNISRARVVVPWDVAFRPTSDARRDQFTRWLSNARAYGVEPYVTMGPSDQVLYNGTCSMRAPTRDEFEDAFNALRSTFSVTLIGVWNEPNFTKNCTGGSSPRVVTPSGRPFDEADCPSATTDNCGPLASAFYWRLAKANCPSCILPAGEFDSTPNDSYWDAYKTYLRDHRPKLWSIHPYTDGNRFQASGDTSAPATNSFVNQLQGTWATANDGTVSHIWLTEVGAYRRNASGTLFGDDSQRDTTAFILRLPDITPRITRIYYYNFQNSPAADGSCPVQDRGLVAPAAGCGDTPNRERPAYSTIATRDTSP